MDVQFEGQNVDRHLDLTTSNHASPPPNEGAPMSDMDTMSKDCPHANLKRDPEKGEHPINQEARKDTQRRKVAREDAAINRMVDKAAAAEAAGDAAGAAQLLDAAAERDRLHAGARFEQKVADDTNAQEINVKITCRDCGKVIAEYDVVTEDGTVKECKSSWNQVSEEQFVRETALAQRPDVFGPGTVVHIAVPDGQRGRLDRKFSDKSVAAGKIQEH
jgi:hypothetical protein